MHALIAALLPLNSVKIWWIGPVTLEENSLESKNCVATRQQFDDRRSFGTLAFQNKLEYHNSDFSELFAITSVHYVKILYYSVYIPQSLRRKKWYGWR